ncbi:hypothetical protein K450DRAFT_233742 [Umbelopsis ramanniana AG]|uniref:Uncharacterized protein n=1 Tax=Umbelopsis ramanniana AG TaxID=1314678 RepID=A0AAD5EC46_UMBRA|nr:uncharacterized protein K450DRAFT_233742 [Umbelopsis ramanniana AG]KAI8581233.1 hypothetical protein K450DRAFT_233742 [Umbelopsis ramanniana AG]
MQEEKDCWNDVWSAGGRTGILYGSDCFRRVTPPPPCLFRFWYGELLLLFSPGNSSCVPAPKYLSWLVNYSVLFVQYKCKQKYNNNNKIKIKK